MKLAVMVGTAQRDWEALRSFALECERIGVDSIWSAEFAGHDAFTPLAFVAAHTQHLKVGTGIVPIGTRSPTLLALSAIALASASGGRFILGLGASFREGIEGEHGVRFNPASRHLREVAQIVRMVASGEPIVHSGEFYTIPVPGRQSFALEPGLAAEFPIYFASLSVKSLEVTGEVADGWVGGISFMPELAQTFLGPIASGAARAGRSIADLDIMAPALILPGGIDEALVGARPFVAQVLSQMGHHPAVYRRSGYGELCDELASHFAAGRDADAIALVPDELVLNRCLAGDDETISQRLRAYRDAGVTTLQIYSFFPSLTDALDSIARIHGLLSEVNAAASR